MGTRMSRSADSLGNGGGAIGGGVWGHRDGQWSRGPAYRSVGRLLRGCWGWGLSRGVNVINYNDIISGRGWTGSESCHNGGCHGDFSSHGRSSAPNGDRREKIVGIKRPGRLGTEESGGRRGDAGRGASGGRCWCGRWRGLRAGRLGGCTSGGRCWCGRWRGLRAGRLGGRSRDGACKRREGLVVLLDASRGGTGTGRGWLE